MFVMMRAMVAAGWLLLAGTAFADAVTLLADGAFEPALREAIAEAKEEVVVAVFLFKADGPPTNHARQMSELLGETVARGVRVRVILETANEGGQDVARVNHHTAKRLRDAGVDVAFDDPRRRYHGKFAVVDGRMVFLGSHNWTDSALRYNREVSLRIDDPSLARQLLDYAAELAGGDARQGVPR
ncbi:MAG: phospholipase D-like domain-containing protein [Nitrospirota bacterium]|jgi:phosphatidylserine/phosphatidylglycerophosphate/cardiolipin synthase-like enzyme